MLREFLHQAKRIFKVAKKPDSGEYLNVSKITGIGIVIIGVIGFIIKLAATLIKGG